MYFVANIIIHRVV